MDKFSLNPLNALPRSHPIAAFDTEGDGSIDGFILGAVVSDQGIETHYSRQTMVDSLLSKRFRGYRLVAHNLEYDWGVLFQDDTSGWQVYRLRSRIIKAVYRDDSGHSWVFWDSSNHSAFQSVAALGRILGKDKIKTPDYIKLDGSSSLSKVQLTPDQLSELAEYCVRDTEIVYQYMLLFQNTVNALGGQVQATLASTAMDLYRRSYQERPYHTPHPWHNEKLRPGYYGGRTEVFRYGQGQGLYQYDVHSLYPSVMVSVPLPDPDTGYFIETGTRSVYIDDMPGVTHATVTAPDVHIPLLPVRVEGRLLFTTGTFTGTWTNIELREAIQLGYRLDKIHWQYLTKSQVSPLTRYVADLYELKERSQRERNPIYFVYKVLLNSLYGKFGQHSDSSYTKLQSIADVPNFLQKIGVDVLYWQGEGYISTPVAPGNQPAYIIVPWASYITAGARLREYELLTRYGDQVCYGDTDCVVGPWALDTGPELGQLGLERGPVDFVFRAEKYYAWSEDGANWSYKKAGVPTEKQPVFWETGQASYSRPTKLGESIQHDKRLSVWFKTVKTDRPRHMKRLVTSNYWYDDRLMDTVPWTYNQALNHYASARKLLPWRNDSQVYPQLAESAEIEYLDSWQIGS